MTNEEAKAFMQSRIDLIDKNYPQVEDYREALEMAIKALKIMQGIEDAYMAELFKTPLERGDKISSCEDCISRKAVLDIIDFEDKWLYDANSHNADTKIAFSGLKSSVKDLPSVTPTYDLEDYSTKLWKLAHERGKAEGEQRNG